MTTLRNGHTWLFVFGIFLPFLWIVGALIGPAPRAPRTVWALIVAASLLALASILTTWVQRQMLDGRRGRTRAPT